MDTVRRQLLFGGGSGDVRQLQPVPPLELSELRAITHNVSGSFLLGEGGFGKVHKGYVDDSLRKGLKAQAVVVKLLDMKGPQGQRMADVRFLWQLRHTNLVKLIGYCCEDEERLLVYEFLPRGSLENHLSKRISVSLPGLPDLRLQSERPTVSPSCMEPINPSYTDTSNLLTSCWTLLVISLPLTGSRIYNRVIFWVFAFWQDFSAKLSHFGLAKMGQEGSDTHVTTRVMGTLGYTAPEYVTTWHLTTKSDVYSFGVLLLELLTGRRALDKLRGKSEQNLVDWVKLYLTSSRRIHHIMDSRLNGQYSVKGAKGVALLARQCNKFEPERQA